MALSITHAEFAHAYGFDSTSTWKELSIGIFMSSQKSNLDTLVSPLSCFFPSLKTEG